MDYMNLEYYDALWQDSMPKDGMQHTKETWNKKAETWFDNPPELQKKKQDLVSEVAGFLFKKGALTQDSRVADIGCGSGDYALEFAKYAKEVVGTDISSRMIDYCKRSALDAGVSNVQFFENDFISDPASEVFGDEKFDLVFTSLTPAMSGLKSVYDIHALSKGWCFNNSFVYRKDLVKNKVLEDVFGKKPNNNWGNSSPYCLFNILWLMGLHPEMTYYTETVNCTYDLNLNTAKYFSQMVIRDKEPDDGTVKKVFEYLASIAQNGKISNETESMFAWTLWKTE